MVKRVATHFPKGINTYVPDMVFAADVVNSCAMVDFGAPATLDVDGIIALGAITSTAKTFTTADFASTIAAGTLSDQVGKIDAPYGRNLTIHCNGSAGSGVITVTGRDYVGQRVRELFSCGSTAVAGKKAFKWVDSIAIAAGANSTVSLNAGWGDVLGLPYKTRAVGVAIENGSKNSAGTFVAGVSATATSSTGDTRGTYAPNNATNGTITYQVELYVDQTELLGIEQF